MFIHCDSVSVVCITSTYLLERSRLAVHPSVFHAFLQMLLFFFRWCGSRLAIHKSFLCCLHFIAGHLMLLSSCTMFAGAEWFIRAFSPRCVQSPSPVLPSTLVRAHFWLRIQFYDTLGSSEIDRVYIKVHVS